MAPVPVNGEKNRLFRESHARPPSFAGVAIVPGKLRRGPADANAQATTDDARLRAAGDVTRVGIEVPTTRGGAGTRTSPRGDCAPGLWLANITLTSILPMF